MKISPTIRISIGLVLLTLSILMLADLAGLAPDQTKEALDKRKKVTESLAVQFSVAARDNDFSSIEETLKAVVQRNDDVLSAGLRSAKGKLLAQAGDHVSQWTYQKNGKSTPTHVIVPIFQGKKQWGSVELRYTPLLNSGFLGLPLSPVAKLLWFVSLLGFAGYTFLMHRTLRYLNPSSIVPGRVQFALDALRSGVALIDNDGSIVLANATFCESHDTTSEELLGKSLDIFEWRDTRNNRRITNPPWTDAIKQARATHGGKLRLNPAGKLPHTYIVNCTPILDANQKSRGALVSFEDITNIQSANDKLKKTLVDLEESRDKIEKQNQKLTILATRDSLTGCFNRRFFFEQFDSLFVVASEQNQTLSCIMSDIDHFKAINDTYGHIFGDQAIKCVAEILESESRSVDMICRYGGEEFCILMPDISPDDAMNIAERLRFSIEKLVSQRLEGNVRITSSFGVTSTTSGATNPLQLVSQADQALYAAKQKGRNRVIAWTQELELVPEKQASDDQVQASAASDESALSEVDDAAIDTVLEPLNININQLQHRIYELETVVEQQSRELLLKTAYDTLTGLPNRILFQDRISQAVARGRREKHKVAVLSLDIEAFKRINDTLGNTVADELVRKVSGHLTEVLRSTDTIALLNKNNSRTTVSRINMDEFGILITDLDSDEPVTWIIKRIFSAMERRAEIDKHEIYLNSCIGISMFPNDGDSAETLVNNASSARYHASRKPGTNRHQFYSSELDTTSTNQIKMETELGHAIQNNALTLHYQPKLNIGTGKLIGVEALLRWNHPSKGMIPPAEFIPVAERSGLINRLGDMVLMMACKQARQWIETISPDLCVSVNLSAIQLRQADLAKKIRDVLEITDLQPQHLELEITESVAISGIESAIKTIEQLQNQGVRISLDDFGTGFSSLSQLKLLPVDTLKIDRSFITDMTADSNNVSIIAATIAMAHKLGLNVLAEGVETVEQLNMLRKLKCNEIQGYLVSMPLPAEELEALFRSSDDHLAALTAVEHAITAASTKAE